MKLGCAPVPCAMGAGVEGRGRGCSRVAMSFTVIRKYEGSKLCRIL